MRFLKQSTAVTVVLGPFVDDTDGKTAETGLTISQADVRLSKNGGDFAQKNDANAATHDELGYYDVALDATDTGTLGALKVVVSESGALPVWEDFMVMPANVWDSLFGADLLQVDCREFGSSALDLTSTMKTSVGDACNDEVVEGTLTLRQIARILLAFVAGKCSGGGTTSIAYRNQADTLDRIDMTVNSDGDRSATSVNGS